MRAPRLQRSTAGHPDGPAQRLTYEPKGYSNTFTADLPPALIVRPGDIVPTRTIDSGGVDHQGRVAALYDNPQTGPFYVVGAKAGDVLAIHIRRARRQPVPDTQEALATSEPCRPH